MKIEFKCQVADMIPFMDLVPLQGKLKKRTDEDVKTLAQSLRNDGLLTPFVLWYKPDLTPEQQINYLLDGHARHAAIMLLGETDRDVLKQEYPYIHIVAKDLEEAKNQLLQISSSYGRITGNGLVQFLGDTPKIKLENYGIKVKLPEVKIKLPEVKKEDKAVIKLRVPKDKVVELTQLLATVKFVEVL